ncbi:circumsporozoite protein-like [Carya illinoinensis]|uniref:circumsporozoite protein-like n=1 Tax=Carya illinoinensis TaxID=32201 RepID=UPI001C7223B2|nr:circumsporozoite protein-like [Carya illinoinensis]
MGESARGRGYRRGIRARRFAPYQSRMRGPRGAKITSYHSHSEADQSGSDDSTQPPSHPWEQPCPNPLPPPEPIRDPPPESRRAPSPVREPPPETRRAPSTTYTEFLFAENTDLTIPTMPNANEEQPKRRRGPAKCLEFEKLR